MHNIFVIVGTWLVRGLEALCEVSEKYNIAQIITDANEVIRDEGKNNDVEQNDDDDNNESRP